MFQPAWATMDISDNLLCLFSAEIQDTGGSFEIEVPKREVNVGDVEAGEVYRIAIVSSDENAPAKSQPHRGPNNSDPPVEKGEIVDVEVEDIGDQGDGIARVGPGYVVIISNTEMGERVSVEITEARDNVAFGDVVEYYDRKE